MYSMPFHKNTVPTQHQYEHHARQALQTQNQQQQSRTEDNDDDTNNDDDDSQVLTYIQTAPHICLKVLCVDHICDGDVVSAGVLCFSAPPGGEDVFFLLSKDKQHRGGKWSHLGGGRHPGETIEETAAREWCEESLGMVDVWVPPGFASTLPPPVGADPRPMPSHYTHIHMYESMLHALRNGQYYGRITTCVNYGAKQQTDSANQNVTSPTHHNSDNADDDDDNLRSMDNQHHPGKEHQAPPLGAPHTAQDQPATRHTDEGSVDTEWRRPEEGEQQGTMVRRRHHITYLVHVPWQPHIGKEYANTRRMLDDIYIRAMRVDLARQQWESVSVHVKHRQQQVCAASSTVCATTDCPDSHCNKSDIHQHIPAAMDNVVARRIAFAHSLMPMEPATMVDPIYTSRPGMVQQNGSDAIPIRKLIHALGDMMCIHRTACHDNKNGNDVSDNKYHVDNVRATVVGWKCTHVHYTIMSSDNDDEPNDSPPHDVIDSIELINDNNDSGTGKICTLVVTTIWQWCSNVIDENARTQEATMTEAVNSAPAAARVPNCETRATETLTLVTKIRQCPVNLYEAYASWWREQDALWTYCQHPTRHNIAVKMDNDTHHVRVVSEYMEKEELRWWSQSRLSAVIASGGTYWHTPCHGVALATSPHHCYHNQQSRRTHYHQRHQASAPHRTHNQNGTRSMTVSHHSPHGVKKQQQQDNARHVNSVRAEHNDGKTVHNDKLPITTSQCDPTIVHHGHQQYHTAITLSPQFHHTGNKQRYNTAAAHIRHDRRTTGATPQRDSFRPSFLPTLAVALHTMQYDPSSSPE